MATNKKVLAKKKQELQYPLLVYGVRPLADDAEDLGMDLYSDLDLLCSDLADPDGLKVAVYEFVGVRTLRLGKPRLED